MDNIIVNKLSEIEDAAERIIENANAQKKEISLSMEQKTKEFDKQVEADTQKCLSDLKDKLTNEMNQELAKLQIQTETTISSMDRDYNNNHTEIANSIINKLIGV